MTRGGLSTAIVFSSHICPSSRLFVPSRRRRRRDFGIFRASEISLVFRENIRRKKRHSSLSLFFFLAQECRLHLTHANMSGCNSYVLRYSCFREETNYVAKKP